MTDEKINKWIRIFSWIAPAMVLISLLVVFFFAPTEQTMGNVQRIFYFHVGAAWVAGVAFLVALIAGVSYLRKPSVTKDTIALGSVEVGLVFTSMTIVAGSIWGYPAWNTWWIWSPRLTSITVLWLVYLAYFMLRGAVEDDEKRRRFGAVYVIVGFVTVLITFASIRFLRDVHPVMFGASSEAAQGLQEFSGSASRDMVITLNVVVLTYSALYALWLFSRIRLQRLIDRTAVMKSILLTKIDG